AMAQPETVWEFRLFKTPEGKNLARSRDIVEDASGGIWVATWGEGVQYFYKTEWENYTTEDGLPGDWARCIEVDSSGRVWVGTGDGLARKEDSGWVTLVPPAELSIPLDNIYLLERMKDDVIWVADDLGNLLSYDETAPEPWKIILEEKATEGGRIDSVAEVDDGTIWVTLQDKNLFHFDGTKWSHARGAAGDHGLRIGPRNSRVDNLIAADTSDLSIYQLVDGEWVSFPACERKVNSIANSPTGQLYVGTNHGVYRYNEGQWDLLDLGREVGRPEIDGFQFASDGSLWIGTREGLVRGYLPSWSSIEGISKILFRDPDNQAIIGIDSANGIVVQEGEGWESVSPLAIPSIGIVGWTGLFDRKFWILSTSEGSRFEFDLNRISIDTG
ncbi:MAG: hypothetical protein KC931_25990, partial [Candidatus Omnitrophica bacterium]|nr:hypothetical protein [Candidatus Omnitrophota bacterium]